MKVVIGTAAQIEPLFLGEGSECAYHLDFLNKMGTVFENLFLTS
jgi:hypothetical protein